MGSSKGYLMVLDEATGKILWNVSGGYTSTPTVYNGKIYVVNMDTLECRNLYTGKLIWRVNDSIVSGVNPIVVNNIVLVNRHVVTAYDADTGKELWTATEVNKINSSGGWQLASNGKVVLSGSSTSLFCFRILDGKLLWEQDFSKYGLDPVYLHSSPVIIGDSVLYLVNFYYIVKVRLGDGGIQWIKKLEGVFESPPSVANGRIYVLTSRITAKKIGKNRLYCLDLNTGSEIWHVDLSEQPSGSPVVTNSMVIVLNGWGGKLQAYDFNGKKVWESSVPVSSTPFPYNGKLYARGVYSPKTGVFKDVIYVFGKAKNPSSIEASVSSTVVEVGEEVEIRGYLNPPISTIVYLKKFDGKWHTISETATAGNGDFSFVYRFQKTGEVMVRVEWNGNKEYLNCSSKILTIKVVKAKPEIHFKASYFNGIISVEGNITPPIPNVKLLVKYLRPGYSLAEQVYTDERGRFKSSVKGCEGNWKIVIDVIGDSRVEPTFKVKEYYFREKVVLLYMALISIAVMTIALIILLVSKYGKESLLAFLNQK